MLPQTKANQPQNDCVNSGSRNSGRHVQYRAWNRLILSRISYGVKNIGELIPFAGFLCVQSGRKVEDPRAEKLREACETEKDATKEWQTFWIFRQIP